MVFNMSELERLVHEMAELNTAFYPLQIVFAALAIGLTVLSFIRPSKWVDRGTKLYLGILYSIISWGVAVCYFNLRGGYYLFTALNHSLVALLFFSSIREEEISFNLRSSKHGLLPVLLAYGSSAVDKPAACVVDSSQRRYLLYERVPQLSMHEDRSSARNGSIGLLLASEEQIQSDDRMQEPVVGATVEVVPDRG